MLVTKSSVCLVGNPWLNSELSEREALMSCAEQLAQMGSWVWDFRTQEVGWSDGLFGILGLRPDHDEPTVELFEAAVHPDDWDRFEGSGYLCRTEDGRSS